MSTRTSKARLVAICCCCRRHATAPTHHIARSCQRLGLFVLVRASLDDSVNTKLSAGGDFDSPVKRGIFAPLERKSSAFPTAISNRRSVENCKLLHMNHKNRCSAARTGRTGKCVFRRALEGPCGHFSRTQTKTPTQKFSVRIFR